MQNKFTGIIFNKIYSNVIFYKLLNESENHNNYQFVEGMNVDSKQYGISFVTYNNVKYWTDYDNKIGIMKWMRRVIIPNDSLIYYDKLSDIFITNKLILCEKEDIWLNYNLCKEILSYDGMMLKYVKNQTYKLCEIAVMQNGISLQFVSSKHKDKKICELAVINNRFALQFVDAKFQSEKICECALFQNPDVFEYIHSDALTLELCELAIIQNSDIIDFIDPNYVFYNYLAKFAVSRNGNSIQYVKKITDEIRKLAVIDNPQCVKHDGLSLKFIKYQNMTLCIDAVLQNGLALQYVQPSFKTPELCKIAVNQNIDSTKYINKNTNDQWVDLLVNKIVHLINFYP